MFKLISDGGCDFENKDLKKHNIDIVPFYISFDQQTYLKEGVDIRKEEYFTRLIREKNLFPKTAQPSPQDYIDVCEKHLKKGMDVMILTIASNLSGSNNSANLAANMLIEQYPDRKVLVVDSRTGSIGQGLILEELVKMRDEKYDIERAREIIMKVIETTTVYFTLDSLEYLKRGGRINSTTAFVGNMLGINPILQLQQGSVSQMDKVRGKKRAQNRIEEVIGKDLSSDAEKINFSFGHILNENQANLFKKNIEDKLNIKVNTKTQEVGAAIGTHAGPGAMAVAYCKKYNTFL